MLMGSMKMKRKSVSDHFSDFFLSSPPIKIRRLAPEEDQPQPPMPEPVTDDERALVLFKPPPFSLSVDSNIISAIKDKQRWSKHSDLLVPAEQNDRLAVVPWVPSQFPPNTPTSHVSNTDRPDLMDIEVDVEEDSSNSTIHPTLEGLHHWQQQHCLIPQLPHMDLAHTHCVQHYH